MATSSNLEALPYGARAAAGPTTPGRLLAFPQPAPPFPILPATRLQLEWLLAEPHVDLNALREIVLGDPGAALALLNRACEECDAEAGLPERIEECLAVLDLRQWLENIQQAPPALGAVAAEWRRARTLAQTAAQLAQQTEWVAPQTACLAALVHGLCQAAMLPDCGLLPPAESLEEAGIAAEAALGPLPSTIHSLLAEARQPGSRWSQLLIEAHQHTSQAMRVA